MKGIEHKRRWRNATNNSGPDPKLLDEFEDSELLSLLRDSNLTVGQLNTFRNGSEHRQVARFTCTNPRRADEDQIHNVAQQATLAVDDMRRCDGEDQTNSLNMESLRRLVRSELECERLNGEVAALQSQVRQLEAINEDLRCDLVRAVDQSHTAIDAAMEASQLVAGERELRRRRRRERDLQREASMSAAALDSLRSEKATLETGQVELERQLREARRTAQDARQQVPTNNSANLFPLIPAKPPRKTAFGARFNSVHFLHNILRAVGTLFAQ